MQGIIISITIRGLASSKDPVPKETAPTPVSVTINTLATRAHPRGMLTFISWNKHPHSLSRCQRQFDQLSFELLLTLLENPFIPLRYYQLQSDPPVSRPPVSRFLRTKIFLPVPLGRTNFLLVLSHFNALLLSLIRILIDKLALQSK